LPDGSVIFTHLCQGQRRGCGVGVVGTGYWSVSGCYGADSLMGFVGAASPA
jgi:hypothetical protein